MMLTPEAREAALCALLDRAEKEIAGLDAARLRMIADATPEERANLTHRWARMQAAAALAVVFPDGMFIARGGPEAGTGILYRLTRTSWIRVTTERTVGASLWETLEALIPVSAHRCPKCARQLPPQDDSPEGWSCRGCRAFGVREDLTEVTT